MQRCNPLYVRSSDKVFTILNGETPEIFTKKRVRTHSNSTLNRFRRSEFQLESLDHASWYVFDPGRSKPGEDPTSSLVLAEAAPTRLGAGIVREMAPVAGVQVRCLPRCVDVVGASMPASYDFQS